MLKWFKQLFSASPGGRPPSRLFSYSYATPSGLGFRQELAGDAYGLLQRLDSALDEPFMRQVRERVLSRHPQIGHAQYGWMELELKRFFVLAVLLRSVPMYSDEADLVWHEMLMFTREYQRFCDGFAGFYIHHQPNVNPASMDMDAQTDERAVFELVYSSLFDVAPENQRLLGPFYRRKINPELMEKLQSMSRDRLRDTLRFRDSEDPHVTAVQDAIVSVIQETTLQARSYHEESHMGRRSSFFGGADPLWTMLAFGMATDLSPFNPSDADHDGQRDNQAGSSCSGWVGGDSGDNGGGSGSSDGGGGSSCSGSSCGSSCGSS